MSLKNAINLYDKIEIPRRDDGKYYAAGNAPFGAWFTGLIKYKGEHADYYSPEFVGFVCEILNNFEYIKSLEEKNEQLKEEISEFMSYGQGGV